MFKSQELNAVKIILLVVIIAGAGWFILQTFSNRNLSQAGAVVPTPAPSAHDKQMFMLGGGDGDDGTHERNDVWQTFDGTNWNLISPHDPNTLLKWSPRQAFSTVATLNKIFVLGGAHNLYWPTQGTIYYNDVWSSSDGINWIQLTAHAPWAARAFQGSVFFNNKIWLFGGGSGSNYYSDVWVSSNGAEWTQITPSAPWGTRSLISATVYQNKIWVIAGWANNGAQHDVWSSSDGVNWTQATANGPFGAVPATRRMAVSFLGSLWIFQNDNPPTGSLLKQGIWSSVNGSTWNASLYPIPFMPYGRSKSVLNIFQGNAYIIGGSKPNILPPGVNSTWDIWKSGNGVNWTQVTANPPWGARGNMDVVSTSF